MTSLRFILTSLRHHRRIHIAVALGVAVATAVLCGALLVGDSVRGGLRELTLRRLGRIDEVLVAGHLFREALTDELADDAEFQQHFTAAEPAILSAGTLQSGSGRSVRRANRVSVVACRDSFWQLGPGGLAAKLGEGEVAITETLARELAVKAGDSILLRIPTARAIPADSPLGEKSETSLGRTLRVAAVLSNEGLARFALQPSQQLPRNVFLPLGTLQRILDKPGRANAILVAGQSVDRPADAAASQALQAALHPKLEDYSLRVEQLSSPTDCIQISADELVLPDEVVQAAQEASGNDALQSIVTYMANTLVVGEPGAERKIPYSTITGVDSTAALGPLLDASGEPIRLADDEIALNRWAADDVGAKLGDVVTVTFYEPESTHGVLQEHLPPLRLRLAHIVELEASNGPTRAADPQLTPELPGVTDQESINDWDLPFDLVENIRPQDEDYWDTHRTTPKAFVSLAAAKRLWSSRWGTISLLRLHVAASHVAASLRDADSDASLGETRLSAIADQLTNHLDPASLGMTFLPVKRLGLDAASGTTPFDGLFLGFSFFLIAAAVMLIALLFQLGVEQRAGELGILAAVGLRQKKILRLLAMEGLLVAAIGAAIGVAAGVAYAGLMITGLRTWWVAAVAAPFLELHVTPRSLVVGWLAGVVVSWLTIRWSIHRLVRLPAGRLLAGVTTSPSPSWGGEKKPRHLWPIVRAALLLLTIAVGAFAFTLRGEVQAGAFFASGALVLAIALGEVRSRLRGSRRGAAAVPFSLASLSALNTSRNPGRSTLTIGLVATASFLIVAMSAFRLDTSDEGTGGFALVATSDQSIHFDLNTPAGRAELGFSNPEGEQLDTWCIYSLRVHAGEDASCLNLYQPTQPRVLGVPESLIERGGFGWAAAARLLKDNEPANKWKMLQTPNLLDDEGRTAVPVVLDANTATYSLHLGGIGSQFTIQDAADRPVTLEVVGLLKNSLLQGSLLVSEENFLRLYPDTGGYRFFLIEQRDKVLVSEATSPAQLLEQRLADDGFDAQDAQEQLAGFLAVQNTYLSTFQSLGALGLLLGTVGLAVVQLRSVLERRGELALLRAAGFPRGRLVRMVVWENGVLLLGGLAIGTLAAAVALVPYWLPHGAGVPWTTLAALLLVIAVVGLAAGWLATRSALRAPLLPALRGD